MDEKNKKAGKLSLEDLIDIAKWQKIQDIFSTVTDIGLRTIDTKGELITTPSGESRLCTDFIQVSNLQHDTCKTCLPAFLGGHAVLEKNLSFICPTGFHHFIAPLAIAPENIQGYVILGPVILVSRKSKEQYVKIAEDLEIDPEAFWSAVLEIKVLSFYRVQTIINLIKDTGAYILRMALEKSSMSKEIKAVLSESSSRLCGLLDKFLGLAVQVSGADIGSIMMLNHDSNELAICAAKGLDYEVVQNTHVKLGEGISGTAARDNASFLIDDVRSADNRIKRYLNRPHIKSSMVLPIRTEDQTLGVMNLGTLASSPLRFSSDDVHAMSELIGLATLALSTPHQK
jgi:putative methionine-R-sulfoxide reductase with GAF domain